MTDTKQKAMDLAEDSREKEWKYPSFVAELFKGNFKGRGFRGRVKCGKSNRLK